MCRWDPQGGLRFSLFLHLALSQVSCPALSHVPLSHVVQRYRTSSYRTCLALSHVPSRYRTLIIRIIVCGEGHFSAIDLVDLCVQHCSHVPCLNADHRQARFGQSIELPLRKRSGFQSNPFEAVGGVPQNVQHNFPLARHLHFLHDPARVIHNADAGLLDRCV